MNTNMLHNLLNLIGVIIGALLSYDWTQLGLDAEQAARIAAGVLLADKIIKFAINILRDGLAGLWLPQPPVDRH